MDIRTAITSWAGAGAAENARRSLGEWTRAQDEVAALLDRLDRRDAPDGEPTTHSAA
jgi:hypothetical protein